MTTRLHPSGVGARAALAFATLALALAACGGSPESASPAALASDGSSPAASGTSSPSTSASASARATASPRPTATPVPTATPAPTATPKPTLVPTQPPTEPPPVSEFPQSWTGSWEDPVTGGSGALALTLAGKDDAFAGTIALDGTACLADGVLEGSYDGRDIEFSVTQRGTVVEFRGRVVDDALEGTFRSDCDGMDGIWTAQRAD